MNLFFRCLASPLMNRTSAILLLTVLALPAFAQSRRVISGHVIPETSHLQSLEPLPATNHLSLVLGLPLRNQLSLDQLLRDLHDPASTNYHQWLTPEQFTARFGPMIEDYQKVVAFAGQHGFKITGTHSNRMMVNVDAPVSNIENAFNLALHEYQHPKENRTF